VLAGPDAQIEFFSTLKASRVNMALIVHSLCAACIGLGWAGPEREGQSVRCGLGPAVGYVDVAGDCDDECPSISLTVLMPMPFSSIADAARTARLYDHGRGSERAPIALLAAATLVVSRLVARRRAMCAPGGARIAELGAGHSGPAQL
jgi:hypothetical protein